MDDLDRNITGVHQQQISLQWSHIALAQVHVCQTHARMEFE